jgi:PAS domain S-box-containing protein
MEHVPARKLIESANHYQKLFESSQDGILILDFESGKIEDANPYITKITGFSKSELIGKQLWEVGAFTDKVAALAAFKVLSDSGYIRYKNLPLISKLGDVLQVEFISNVYDLDHHRIIQCQIRDISKEKEMDRLLSNYKDSASQSLTEMAAAFSLLIEQRDSYTAGHQHRVAKLVAAIGQELNLEPHVIEGLEFSASIHDIGKIGIPTEILTKPDALNSFEIAMLRNHAQAGFNVIKHINFPWPVAQTVLQHHERMDGSGYPNQIRGTEIILEARILAVADTVEAMCGRRPYRLAPGLRAALETIKRSSGVMYDAIVVDACTRVFENGFSFNGSSINSAEMRDIDHL